MFLFIKKMINSSLLVCFESSLSQPYALTLLYLALPNIRLILSAFWFIEPFIFAPLISMKIKRILNNSLPSGLIGHIIRNFLNKHFSPSNHSLQVDKENEQQRIGFCLPYLSQLSFSLRNDMSYLRNTIKISNYYLSTNHPSSYHLCLDIVVFK